MGNLGKAVALAVLVAVVSVAVASCGTLGRRDRYYPPPPPAAPSSPGEPLTPEPAPPEAEVPEAAPAPAPAAGGPPTVVEGPLPVARVAEEIVVEAWAEPRHFPPWGGEVQVLVRVKKPNGQRYPGVEVRLATSTGTLFSNGGILVTDSQGMTRDRLTAREAATITLNAGGTRFRFLIPVAGSPP